MPDEAYNSAIFDEDEDSRTASGSNALVELDPGCAGHDTPADSPGGRLMTSGCAGCDTPAAIPWVDQWFPGVQAVTHQMMASLVNP